MKKINLSEKNKRRLLIILGGLFVVIVLALSIPKDVYQKLFTSSDITIDNSDQDLGPKKLVYVFNKDNELVGINLSVDENDDEIVQKWDLLTKKINTYPVGYYSAIETTSTLLKYEICQNVLTLNLSNDFLNSDGKNAIASIAWTFCQGDIEEVSIIVDGNKINKLKDYQFTKANKSINVNYLYETSYLFEANFVTIIHNSDNLIKPVTYFFKDEEPIDFIVSMMFDDFENLDEKEYSYEYKDKEFILNLLSDSVINPDDINLFKTTMLLNFDLDSITINNSVMTIYEEDFIKESSVGSNESFNNQINKE